MVMVNETTFTSPFGRNIGGVEDMTTSSSADENDASSWHKPTSSSSRKRSRHSANSSEKDRENGDVNHDDDDDHDDLRRRVKHSKHSKHEKKSKHRKRYHHDYDDRSSVSSSTESSDAYRRDRKSRHKSDRHDKKKKDRKRHKKKDRHTTDDNGNDTKSMDTFDRNHLLVNSLCSLFNSHADFANELPIILIRLGRGATFDLCGMTDQDAAQRLISVLQCLSPFGVTLNDNNIWSWKNPVIDGSSSSNNELVLIRVVRALLDQIGITLDAIDEYENPPLNDVKLSSAISSLYKDAEDTVQVVENEVEQRVGNILETFRSNNLTDELAGICTMILEGEMVNLDGVPDDAVRDSLESLLGACGLEKAEMEVDDADVDDNNTNPPMGFGLPPGVEMERAKSMLSSVIDICQSKPKASTRRPVKGPMLPAEYDNDNNISSDDDEGPLPVGAAAVRRDHKISKEQIKSLAAHRAYELACAKEGIDIDPASMNGGVREEWMVVPGKYDFLGSIQTGRSRTFAGKSKLNNKGKPDEPIDPKIQAEIQAIRDAYEETRGPTLMDQHREAKKIEQQQKLNEPTATSWKWNRDKDLDDGRRVDTDALGMILGGAGTDLKNKFQSGV